MKVDLVAAGDMAAIASSSERAAGLGCDGLFTGEKAHDPFVALAPLAAEQPTFDIGTAIAVAFARNPMNLAMMANDLHAASRGRFILGLGSQVATHITRRFSMPWSRPVERMSELVAAIRAIWACWNDDAALDFEGEFYTHTLMSPLFRPQPSEFGAPPIYLAAVGNRMTKVAAEVADGLIVHSFTTEKYLREATLPSLDVGLGRRGRARSTFTVSLPLLVATGESEDAIAAAARATKERIAFYGSTPAYRSVLDVHGWASVQSELNQLAKAGRWAAMADAIDDELLNAFAVVGEPKEIGPEIMRRFDGIVDRISLSLPFHVGDDVLGPIVDWIRTRRTQIPRTDEPTEARPLCEKAAHAH